MNVKYLISDSIVFEPEFNHIYCLKSGKGETVVKHDIGDNSKDILLALIDSDGCMSTEELLEEVWRKKRNIEVDVTSVRQAVSKLRKSFKLIEPEIEAIKTVPKKGYVLDVHFELMRDDLPTKSLESSNRASGYLIAICVAVTTALFSFLAYDNNAFDESPFSKVYGISIGDSNLNVVQSKHHPVDKRLLPIFSQCISQLNLFDADTVVIYSTTEDFLSLTAFYEKPIEKQITFRLILSKGVDEESKKCGF
ncbi:winged helix-turn-helix domain-containing protein [Vibrio hyugaensis]|uniref:winged helix-turn-helix domain-containing protein n=1 Tax=Vibrio hyugaensis TaxID=1534743 RepID=UPI000CE43824|nr:winged helix-turn-helix domain-containing protein [Vibrio hyugaensis]